jgi:hypothetical protein
MRLRRDDNEENLLNCFQVRDSERVDDEGEEDATTFVG